MTWSHFQDPKNPVALHKLFGSLEHSERILDLFNALKLHNDLLKDVTFDKVISILSYANPIEENDELPKGNITFCLQDQDEKIHTLQLFVPHTVNCEKEVFFYGAKAYIEAYIQNQETGPVTTYIISPFSLYSSVHEMAVSHCEYRSDEDADVWLNNLRFEIIQLPKIDYAPEELTYRRDYWFYFFIHFNDTNLKALFAKKDKTGILVKACEDIATDTWSEDELVAYAKTQKAIALKQVVSPPETGLMCRQAFREGIEKKRKELREEEHSNRVYENLLARIREGDRDHMALAKRFDLAPHEVRSLMAQEEINEKARKERFKNYGF